MKHHYSQARRGAFFQPASRRLFRLQQHLVFTNSRVSCRGRVAVMRQPRGGAASQCRARAARPGNSGTVRFGWRSPEKRGSENKFRNCACTCALSLRSQSLSTTLGCKVGINPYVRIKPWARQSGSANNFVGNHARHKCGKLVILEVNFSMHKTCVNYEFLKTKFM